MEQNENYGGWVRNPNHPFIGGKHAIIHRVSTIQGGTYCDIHPLGISTTVGI